jgi:hypothetical protein
MCRLEFADGIGLCVDVMRQRASNERVQHHGCALLNFLALEEKNKETLFEKGAVDVGACPDLFCCLSYQHWLNVYCARGGKPADMW